jgi:UDP-GlcNAc3NAcA epimerase
MNIITIIGTRPQYIKIKPFCDYCQSNNISNLLVDTNQHYSDNVSKDLIEELNLTINQTLHVDTSNEILFLSDGMISISNIYKKYLPDIVVVIGDTNSTLAASITANKMNIKLAHIESGIRCGNKNRPEEVNRILVDELSDIHFISRVKDKKNVSNPIFVGDLEYNFLNNIDIDYDKISYGDFLLMTIHRQENMNSHNLKLIFNYCEDLKMSIIFPVHHRTIKFIKEYNISLPNNINVIDPLTYKNMISIMRECRGIISDSGGIVKTAPFFGKKIVVPLNEIEWDEVMTEGYATNQLNCNWFDDYIIERNKDLYYVENSCEIIIKELDKILK